MVENNRMKSKLIGGVLLIVGTSIGGGMLALPMAAAAGGFFHSMLLFLGAWIVTVLAAFYILEVNLWLPEGTNLVSMAKVTLGKPGQLVTWFAYLLLLYSLLSAYIAGGTDLFHSLLLLVHINSPHWLDSVLFVMILGAILYYGVRAVDWVNRGLMSTKLIAYILLVVLITPHINVMKLEGGHVLLLSGAVMVVITSFGYATIVPTLRTYFKSNVSALRFTIAVGSLVPLICYLLWNMVVQGSIASSGNHGLVHMAVSGHAVSNLTNALSTRLGSQIIDGLTHFFTSICIATSFLGVSLCLSDFLTDGLKIGTSVSRRLFIVGLTLMPPLAIILFYPDVFIIGLNYAGIFCVVLLMLLPALMVWSGRYVTKLASGYEVTGGKLFIILEILISLALLVFATIHLE